MEVPDVLTKEVGPLPVWGWAVAGVGGVFIGRMVANRFGGKSAGESDAAAAPVDDGTSGYLTGGPPLQGGLRMGGTVTSYSNAGTGQSADAPIQSNDEWRARAITMMKAQGYEPVALDAALTRWLAGQSLDPTDESMVNKTISMLGFPPNPPTQTPRYMPPEVAPPTVTPPAAPTPPQTLPTVGVVPPGALVSHDGNTVFWTDYRTIQWVSNGNESIRLWREGAATDEEKRKAHGITDFPVPLPIPLDNIVAMRHVGPVPPGWSPYHWQ